MLKISELAADTATDAVDYRGNRVEFTFRPGAYTGEFATGAPVVDVIAACVTEWNIEVPPTDVVETAKLPWGLLLRVFRKIVGLANQVDPEGEAPAS